MKYLPRYTALFFLFLVCSCTKDIGRVNVGNYPADIDRIISRGCAVSGCHNAASAGAAAGYNLTTWSDMFAGSGSGSPVIPYSSKFSSLCYYINTYPDLGLINTPTMPLNRTPLSYEEVKRISDWIDAGAPDINGSVKWADNPKRKKLYAANQGCDVVTVFDSETQLPIRFIPVGTKSSGNTPHQVRVSPDGNYWYVVFINNNIMQKFRCSDDAFVGNIPLTPLAAGSGSADAMDWNTFVISKDGKYAYCASWTQNGMVSKVDLERMKLVNYLPALYYPHGVVLNAAEDKIYVGAQTGNYIMEIDTGFSSLNELSLQNGVPWSGLPGLLDPHDMILAPNNDDIFITCQNSNEVRVFNIPSGSVTAIIPTGVYPQEIVYSESANQYFVTCTEDVTTIPGAHGVVSRIEGNGYAVTSIRCGFQPHGIAVDEAKKLVYVTSRNLVTNGPAPHHSSQCAGRNGFVNFIDLNSFTLLSKRYELSVDPYFISARP